jgi:hypothetical protein
MNRLERVTDIGCAEIRNAELLLWYGQQRVTVNIWRDIQSKWEEILDSAKQKNDVPLLVGSAPGTWTFIWGEGLVPNPRKQPWFKNVQDLANAFERRI